MPVGPAHAPPTLHVHVPVVGTVPAFAVMLTVMVGFGLVMAVRVHRYSEVTSGKGSLL